MLALTSTGFTPCTMTQSLTLIFTNKNNQKETDNMPLMKKKAVAITTEGLIQEADIQIEAQKDQFRKLAAEVEYGIQKRKEALRELDIEIAALENRLGQRQKMEENELAKLQADHAYLERLNQFIG
jgi:cbb3-type cytochrome oxidase cytochrome c subunit